MGALEEQVFQEDNVSWQKMKEKQEKLSLEMNRREEKLKQSYGFYIWTRDEFFELVRIARESLKGARDRETTTGGRGLPLPDAEAAKATGISTLRTAMSDASSHWKMKSGLTQPLLSSDDEKVALPT